MKKYLAQNNTDEDHWVVAAPGRKHGPSSTLATTAYYDSYVCMLGRRITASNACIGMFQCHRMLEGWQLSAGLSRSAPSSTLAGARACLIPSDRTCIVVLAACSFPLPLPCSDCCRPCTSHCRCCSYLAISTRHSCGYGLHRCRRGSKALLWSPCACAYAINLVSAQLAYGSSLGPSVLVVLTLGWTNPAMANGSSGGMISASRVLCVPLGFLHEHSMLVLCAC